MNSIGRHPLSVLWVYLATRETAGDDNAKLLAVCAAKARQADVREKTRKKEHFTAKRPRTVQNARVSGEVIRVAGYDIELCRSGDKKTRGVMIAQRGPMTGTLSEFDAAWAAVDSATDGRAEQVCTAIKTLNSDEAAHDRFWESSAYSRALEATQNGAYRVFPEALIRLGLATNAA